VLSRIEFKEVDKKEQREEVTKKSTEMIQWMKDSKLLKNVTYAQSIFYSLSCWGWILKTQNHKAKLYFLKTKYFKMI